ncbi:hypothetical protein M2451_003870 [Dysgonomonas sp. PFB1-18]|uniref:hypothetical protein n=1 Tax=unclassified Dysgonomonas TaxID=2630389 RepID=UPI0024734C90|nr:MULTISPECIES: hypothetical protein [unclassified Dysgonomonas]MDH6311215.1 hypothetical protein [Dysgonomonas sp. PF1-14]MDH6341093.1 hypothetical protein [Dysgonomonas sp. PF1-16]MDH6382529.1 hypothetical protein [Dysgonomonas sp. PFB1-18]MDH6399937.1 hypothetical protein [Dysgonomonas sp. PF1-23]
MKKIYFKNYTGYIFLIGMFVLAFAGLSYSYFFTFSIVLCTSSLLPIILAVIWLIRELNRLSAGYVKLFNDIDILYNYYMKKQADEALRKEEQLEIFLHKINLEC